MKSIHRSFLPAGMGHQFTPEPGSPAVLLRTKAEIVNPETWIVWSYANSMGFGLGFHFTAVWRTRDAVLVSGVQQGDWTCPCALLCSPHA